MKSETLPPPQTNAAAGGWRPDRRGRLFSVDHAKAIAKTRLPKIAYDFI